MRGAQALLKLTSKADGVQQMSCNKSSGNVVALCASWCSLMWSLSFGSHSTQASCCSEMAFYGPYGSAESPSLRTQALSSSVSVVLLLLFHHMEYYKGKSV